MAFCNPTGAAVGAGDLVGTEDGDGEGFCVSVGLMLAVGSGVLVGVNEDGAGVGRAVSVGASVGIGVFVGVNEGAGLGFEDSGGEMLVVGPCDVDGLGVDGAALGGNDL